MKARHCEYSVIFDMSLLRYTKSPCAKDERKGEPGEDVISGVYYEIRTPMNAILSFAELLMNERFIP